MAQGDLGGAEEWISRARSDSARHRNEFHLSEIQRLSGDISHALAPHSPDPAEAWYRQALATAETQQAPAPALRAATSLAALWNQCGKPSEALTLLQKSLSQGESHGCPRDLDEARLLRDLIVASTAR